MASTKTKIVFAPNAFKECLSASEACQAMQIGVDKAFKNNDFELEYETVHIPLADGGDGTMNILVEANKGYYRRVSVEDALGRIIDAKYGIFKGADDSFWTAVIETAQSCGIWRLSESEKNPFYTHCVGTGQLIMDALTHSLSTNIGRIIITVGGSATNDAGFGIAKAFGIEFKFENGQKFKDLIPSNANLSKIKSINAESLRRFKQNYKIDDIEIVIGCDVENVLIGENGSTMVYAPQKLSDEWIKANVCKSEPEIAKYKTECFEAMEKNIAHMNDVWTRDLGINANLIKGSGASGGLAAALMIYLDAHRMQSGFEIVAKYVCLDDALKNADLVITGEGSFDSQTANGKVPHGVAKHAYLQGIESVVCIAGSVNCKNDQNEQQQIAKIIPFSIANGPMTLEYSMTNAFDLLTETVYRLVQLFLFSKRHKNKSKL